MIKNTVFVVSVSNAPEKSVWPYQCLVLSGETPFADQLNQAPDQGPVGGSGDSIHALRPGRRVRARRSRHHILFFQHAHRRRRFEVLQSHRLLFQKLHYLRYLLYLRPHFVSICMRVETITRQNALFVCY